MQLNMLTKQNLVLPSCCRFLLQLQIPQPPMTTMPRQLVALCLEFSWPFLRCIWYGRMVFGALGIFFTRQFGCAQLLIYDMIDALKQLLPRSTNNPEDTDMEMGRLEVGSEGWKLLENIWLQFQMRAFWGHILLIVLGECCDPHLWSFRKSLKYRYRGNTNNKISILGLHMYPKIKPD